MHNHADPEQSYAITRAEQSTALLPWRYAQASWEPLDSRTFSWVSRGAIMLAILVSLALIAWAAWQFIPLASGGYVVDIASGSLHIQDGDSGPWTLADVGRVVRPGARMRAEPGTVATLDLADGSLVRIESGGEWVIDRISVSRNTRLKRGHVRHLTGTASFAGAPEQPGVHAITHIELNDVTLELAGVATVEQISDSEYTISVWQGTASLSGYGQRIDSVSGDLMHTSTTERSIAIASGALSR